MAVANVDVGILNFYGISFQKYPNEIAVKQFACLKQFFFALGVLVPIVENGGIDGIMERAEKSCNIFQWGLFDLSVPNGTFRFPFKIQNVEIAVFDQNLP